MGRLFTSPGIALVNLDKRFVRKAFELILLQIEYGAVAVNAVRYTCMFDFGFDKVPIQAADHVAKFPCALLDEIYLNDFTLGKPLLQFVNHGEFRTKEDRVNSVVGFGNHKSGTLHINGIRINDVGSRGVGDNDSIHREIY